MYRLRAVGKSYRADGDNSLLIVNVAITDLASTTESIKGMTLFGYRKSSSRVDEIMKEDIPIKFAKEIKVVDRLTWVDERSIYWRNKTDRKRHIIPPPSFECEIGTSDLPDDDEISFTDFYTEFMPGSDVNFEMNFHSVAELMTSEVFSRINAAVRLERKATMDFLIKPITQLMMDSSFKTETHHWKDPTELAKKIASDDSFSGKDFEKEMLGAWKIEDPKDVELRYRSSYEELDKELDKELDDLINESAIMNEDKWGAF